MSIDYEVPTSEMEKTIAKMRTECEWNRIHDILMIASEMLEDKNPRLSYMIRDIAVDLGERKYD